MRNGRLLQRTNYRLLPWVLYFFLVLPGPAVAAELVVKDAWVRQAPPAARVHAAYMSLANPTDQPIVITRIDANCCAMTMLHETRRDGDTVSMVHLDQLEIPAHSSTHLKPGGLHIMLMRPSQPLREGDEIKLEVTLGDGSSQSISALVKANHE